MSSVPGAESSEAMDKHAQYLKAFVCRWLSRTITGRPLFNILPHRIKSRIVWFDALSDPEFVAASQRGHESVAAGRVIRVRREEL